MNYQKELDKLIVKLEKEERVPTLLLHSCCAPCSSYVLEYLSQYFEITVFYYNPNIYPESEYSKRIIESILVVFSRHKTDLMLCRKFINQPLLSDFKKKNGYKRSVELSKEYGLYRQDYCGCVYSWNEAEERRRQNAEKA